MYVTQCFSFSYKQNNDVITKTITNKNLNNNKYVNTECPTHQTVMEIIYI